MCPYAPHLKLPRAATPQEPPRPLTQRELYEAAQDAALDRFLTAVQQVVDVLSLYDEPAADILQARLLAIDDLDVEPEVAKSELLEYLDFVVSKNSPEQHAQRMREVRRQAEEAKKNSCKTCGAPLHPPSYESLGFAKQAATATAGAGAGAGAGGGHSGVARQGHAPSSSLRNAAAA